MLRRNNALRAIALALPFAVSTGFAQSGADFTSDTRLVILPATVQDKTGHLVTNLTEGQFQVFDDNVQQPLKLFKREDVPVSLGLIIDSSGSMRDKRARVESAAITLVRNPIKRMRCSS